MRTQAKIVDTAQGPRVAVETASGWVDWPIMYDSTGFIAYDAPERVPQFIRPRVKRLLIRLRKRKALIDNSYKLGYTAGSNAPEFDLATVEDRLQSSGEVTGAYWKGYRDALKASK